MHTITHPCVPLDINPPFMLRLTPAPPGLTGRHARLQIWQQIQGTDGLSVQHHLPCFFQPRRCQDQARTHLAECIQWKKLFPSSHHLTGQWVSSLTDINPASPPLVWANWLKPEWAPSGGLVLFCFPQSCSNWVLWHTEQDGLILEHSACETIQNWPLFIFHLRNTNTLSVRFPLILHVWKHATH